LSAVTKAILALQHNYSLGAGDSCLWTCIYS